MKQWVKELKKIVGNDINIAIAGNKIDLEKNRNVTESEAMKYTHYLFLKNAILNMFFVIDMPNQ